jgi:hypothetical protein
MPNVLTSWKEIGQYLGKGVRTVQRWERDSGLPVCRPPPPSHRAVLAFTEELDTWTRTRANGPTASLIEALTGEVAALRNETADLQKRMDLLEKSPSANRE